MGAGRLGGAGEGAASEGGGRGAPGGGCACGTLSCVPVLCQVGRVFNAQTVKDSFGRPVLLFRNAWGIDQLLGDSPDIGPLSAIGLPPSAAELAASRK